MCVVMCPLLIWNGIIYLPNEYYCYIQVSSLRDTIWTGLGCYGIPVSCVFFIYVRLTIFLKYQCNNQTLVARQRQNRDLVIIYRIFITVGAFTIAGTPFISLLLIQLITNVEQPLTLRITWFSVLSTVTGMNVAMVFSTPQLKQIVFRRFQRNQVLPFGNTVTNTIAMRPVTNKVLITIK